MPQTVELPDDLAEVLADEASRLGMTLPDYAIQVLASAHASPKNGAELVMFWQAEGLVGSRSDIADSQRQARDLREQAQQPRT